MPDSSDRSSMRPFTDLAPLKRARAVAARLAVPVDRSVELDLHDAVDRVLAADARSRVDVPSADRAAMDGYVVHAASGLPEASRLRRVGRLAAGEAPEDRPLQAGTCLEIATGAPIPPGADAVVPVEDTRRDDDVILLSHRVEPGQHVSRRGEDLRRDHAVGRTGDVLTPALIAACAAGGRDRVLVRDRPKVLVAPTGDEVVPLGRELKPGQVYDSNAIGLTALLTRAGAGVQRTEIVVDERPRLEELLDRPGFDLIVTIGGTSVGRRDLVSDAVARRGEVLLHGVAVKPGKPLLLGRVGESAVVGLPGFPTTCMMLAYAVLAPMVRAMGGRPSPPATIRAVLADEVSSPPGKTLLLPVAVENGEARSTFRFSSAVSSMARARGWIEVDPDRGPLPAGEPVTVHLF